MQGITLKQAAAVCGGTLVGAPEDGAVQITGVEIDSRRVTAGDLFVAIPGERVDGHRFVPEVLKKGAYALAEQEIPEAEGPYIRVENTVAAMKKLAKYYRSSLDIKVVGITGSVGKTSTKEMMASVLGVKYRVHKTAGNFNNGIGLPLTIFGIEPDTQVAVLEMGISEFGEMHELADMAQPDYMVITNIGLCHLENLITRDGILKAKTESFAHLNAGGRAVLNGDDDKLSTIEAVAGVRPLFYGIEGQTLTEPSVYASDVEDCGLEGMKAKLHLASGTVAVNIPIPGEHNVYNALAAACVAEQLGLTGEGIRRGVGRASTISGRTNLIHAGSVTVIDDCYNANPVSMCAAVDVLCKAKGRKVAVLGDMGELGAEEKQLHHEVGVYVGEQPVDVLFCAGELSRETARGASECNPGLDVRYYEKREAMTEALLPEIHPEDTLLIKASHFMEFPQVVSAVTEYLKDQGTGRP